MRFDHFFQGLEHGFINELVINLYARTFLPGDDIYKPGQRFNEVMFIIKGQIQICEPVGIQEPFCVLPTNSYFGEYQILKEIPSFFSIRAISSTQYNELNRNSKSVVVLNNQFWKSRRKGLNLKNLVDSNNSETCILMCCSK